MCCTFLVEQVVCCRLSPVQTQLYKAVINSKATQSALLKAGQSGSVSSLASIMQLKKICNRKPLLTPSINWVLKNWVLCFDLRMLIILIIWAPMQNSYGLHASAPRIGINFRSLFVAQIHFVLLKSGSKLTFSLWLSSPWITSCIFSLAADYPCLRFTFRCDHAACVRCKFNDDGDDDTCDNGNSILFHIMTHL